MRTFGLNDIAGEKLNQFIMLRMLARCLLRVRSKNFFLEKSIKPVLKNTIQALFG